REKDGDVRRVCERRAAPTIDRGWRGWLQHHWLLWHTNGKALGGHPSFQLDGPGEENIVLQVNVLVEISFKCFQRFIQRAVADTSVCRCGVVGGHGTQVPQYLTRRLVLHHHHANGIVDGAERRKWRWPILRVGLYETEYVGKEYLLFFEHVRLEIGTQSVKPRSDFM